MADSTGEYYQGINKCAIVVGCALSFGLLATGLVSWRLAFRISRRTINSSDYCIAVGMVLAICQGIFNISCYTTWGYGWHKADLPPDIQNSTTPVVLFWVNQIFFKLSTGLTKLSLCFVYRGLFMKADTRLIRVSRNINYGLGIFIAGFYGSTCIASIFQCTPVQKSWLSSLDGHCIDLTSFRYVVAIVNISTSLMVISLPLPALIKLNTRAREVSQVIFLILLGLIHTSCTIVRLVLIIVPNQEAKTDPFWANTGANAAAMIELYIGLIAACLVVMRPCFQFVTRKIFGTSVNGTRSRKNNNNGYALSSIPHSEQKVMGGQITKTIDVKMTSRSVSTEDILRSPDHF